jgi:hypothetical protein
MLWKTQRTGFAGKHVIIINPIEKNLSVAGDTILFVSSRITGPSFQFIQTLGPLTQVSAKNSLETTFVKVVHFIFRTATSLLKNLQRIVPLAGGLFFSPTP